MTRTETVSALADRFAATLRKWLSPAEFSEMKALNETAEYREDICASHNYCDANMAMDAAWRETFGEDAEIDADDEAQAQLWGDAWDVARERHLGHFA